MDDLLVTHALSPELLRQDDFDRFLEDRRRRMSVLVERAMGKAVSQFIEGGEYDEGFVGYDDEAAS